MYYEDDPIKKYDKDEASNVCRQEQKIHQGLDGENQKKWDRMEEEGVDGKIILERSSVE